MHAADTALSLLFKKLHPVLEDTAHALAKGVPTKDLERLHLKLLRARFEAMEVLEGLATEDPGDALQEALDELASNLTPSGETFQQSLILTQLCLEDAPESLLPFLDEAEAEAAPWMKRLRAFQALIQDPTQTAEHRWEAVDPDIGEGGEDED